MLAGMPHSEYVHWQAIYSIEPFPQERADQRTAELLRMMMITAGVKKLPKITDLMPDWWGEHQAPQQTREQIRANMAIVKAAKKKKK
jgi:tripartite-type tricarboxylate transporter receptor subunit TctC